MDQETLIGALREIKAIVDGALTGKIVKANRKTLAPAATKPVNSLPEHLLRLRDGGFFKQPKTYSEAHEKLTSTYPCDTDRVRVALIRLQQGKQLRKTSKVIDGKKKSAYVW